MDDETICCAVIKEWRKRMESPRRKAFGNDDPAGNSINAQAYLEEVYSQNDSIVDTNCMIP